MEQTDQSKDLPASLDELRQAIEQLSTEDLYRLKRIARYALYGTEFQDPQELLNEAILRALKAAAGERGRTWTKSVSFVAFLVMCIRGIANDSSESASQTRTARLEELATDVNDSENIIAEFGHCHAGAEDLAIESEEAIYISESAKIDIAAIDSYFDGDENVSWIIMGFKDNLKAEEIRAMSGMSQTDYETAKRRFRRGLDKLFPGRRCK
ncbi:hypothetical protein [Herbaspirillum huttiense]|uniref:hypothetical protein n=1 Tax=Herbaspirillum huttiense TaxID=863372 RepID=UPI0031CE3844